MPAYFLCDAHLGSNPPGCMPGREERLIELLRSFIGQASHVFILGDLFEFWMEYRHYVGNRHFRLLRALADLVDSGTEVHLLMGNHDFAYADFFPRELGVQVHRHLRMSLQGRNIYMCHGDGLAASDRAYRIARRILDFPLNRFLFRQLHPDWGMALAHWVGGTSREANKEREQPIAEYLESAQALLSTHQCDLFVQGHVHQGSQHTLPAGEAVFCGQWLFALTYMKLENGVCHIIDVS